MGFKAELWNASTEFATDHRGWFVIFFVLPISLAFDVFFSLRAYVIMKFYSAPALHTQRVKKIQEDVRAWKRSGSQRRLCTARGGWQSMSPGYRLYKAKSTKISVRLSSQ